MAPEAARDAHEAPAVNTRRVLLFVTGFVVFALVLATGLRVYYGLITGNKTLTSTLQSFPAPQLQPNPLADYNAFRAAQAVQLDGTAWANKDTTLVHVPIAEAMDIVVARGPKAYDPVEGTAPFPSPGSPPLDGAPRAAPQALASPFGRVR